MFPDKADMSWALAPRASRCYRRGPGEHVQWLGLRSLGSWHWLYRGFRACGWCRLWSGMTDKFCDSENMDIDVLFYDHTFHKYRATRSSWATRFTTANVDRYVEGYVGNTLTRWCFLMEQRKARAQSQSMSLLSVGRVE